MNKQEADRLAETVTIEDLRAMFRNAQESITDWTAPSRVNKTATKGLSYNILSVGLNKENPRIHGIAKRNMIWEFGEYLPEYEKPARRRAIAESPHHQDPNFIDF